MQGIQFTKAGKITAAKIFTTQVDNLQERGATKIILACTELPSVLNAEGNLIDTNLALVERCIRWFQASYLEAKKK